MENISIEITVKANKIVPFTYDDICILIALLNGIAVPALTSESVSQLLGKLNALRKFAEDHE